MAGSRVPDSSRLLAELSVVQMSLPVLWYLLRGIMSREGFTILITYELQHFLLSRGLRKVKDFQSLLWGERDACRGDKVPVTEMK